MIQSQIDHPKYSFEGKKDSLKMHLRPNCSEHILHNDLVWASMEKLSTQVATSATTRNSNSNNKLYTCFYSNGNDVLRLPYLQKQATDVCEHTLFKLIKQVTVISTDSFENNRLRRNFPTFPASSTIQFSSVQHF